MRFILTGWLTITLMLINTITGMIPLTLLAIVKVLVPITGCRRLCSAAIVWIAESWAEMCKRIFALTTRTRWDVRGVASLDPQQSYMIVSNHQSWVDIPALIQALNRKIPYFKFFLKKELMWVPLLGLAWWALDYPFMQRHSKSYLKKHPEQKGADFEATRASCEKFKGTPVSLMNFLEGTRYTDEKRERQSSPYQYLLRPKSGGVAYALQILDGQIRHVLDVTVVYPGQSVPGFWQLVTGQVPLVVVDVKHRVLDDALLQGNFEEDPEYRKRFQAWALALWEEKDRNVHRILEESLNS